MLLGQAALLFRAAPLLFQLAPARLLLQTLLFLQAAAFLRLAFCFLDILGLYGDSLFEARDFLAFDGIVARETRCQFLADLAKRRHLFGIVNALFQLAGALEEGLPLFRPFIEPGQHPPRRVRRDFQLVLPDFPQCLQPPLHVHGRPRMSGVEAAEHLGHKRRVLDLPPGIVFIGNERLAVQLHPLARCKLAFQRRQHRAAVIGPGSLRRFSRIGAAFRACGEAFVNVSGERRALRLLQPGGYIRRDHGAVLAPVFLAAVAQPEKQLVFVRRQLLFVFLQLVCPGDPVHGQNDGAIVIESRLACIGVDKGVVMNGVAGQRGKRSQKTHLFPGRRGPLHFVQQVAHQLARGGLAQMLVLRLIEQEIVVEFPIRGQGRLAVEFDQFAPRFPSILVIKLQRVGQHLFRFQELLFRSRFLRDTKRIVQRNNLIVLRPTGRGDDCKQ